MNKVVGYAFVVADLLHYGHLNFLKYCKKYCGFLIVGVFTDELTMSYKRKPIFSFEERMQLIASLEVVDMVVKVDDIDQTVIMKKLVKEGYNLKYLFHGDNWKEVKGKEYIESIGGQLIQPPYTKGISTSMIINRVRKRYCRRDKSERK